jgi:hypothetical protein
MKTLKPLSLSLVALAGALSAALAEDYRTDINPALVYYRAFLVATQPVPDADWDYLASKKGREQKLPDRFGKIVAGYDNPFTLVRQAAHATVPCDWGIDLSPGPNILLPHLGRAKAVAHAAQLRAVWALQHGRPDDARDDLLAAFVLGRNAASDKFLIGALVQCMIEDLDYGTVAQHFGEFPAEILQQLVAGFEAAPPRHLMADCIPGERSLSDWVLRKIQEFQKAYPNDDAKVMAAFRDCGYVSGMESVGEANLWARLVAASDGTSDGLIRLVREARPVVEKATGLMALPPAEYEGQAKRLSAEILRSPNPFINGLGFLIDKWQQRGIRPREFRVQAELPMVRAAVAYKREGEPGLGSVTDPFGNGPFSYRRFVFEGVDRGFELRSAYTGADAPFVMIFVEKPGAAFEVIGPNAGKPVAE